MQTREQTGQDLIEKLLVSRQSFLDFVSRRIGDPELAEDILQEAFVRAIQSADRLRDDTRLAPWFYQILRNAIVDSYRRGGIQRRHVQPLHPDFDREDVPPEDEGPLCECFRSLILTLKPEYAELLERVELGHERPDDLADHLGITSNNLKVRRHRARQALRGRLEEVCRTCADHACLDCTCGR